MRLCAVAILRGTSAEPRAPATMTAPLALALSSLAAQAESHILQATASPTQNYNCVTCVYIHPCG